MGLLFGLAALIVLVYGLRAFAKVDPARLARLLRGIGGLLAILAALVMLVTGKVFFSLPLFGLGLGLLGSAGRESRTRRSAGRTSVVRTGALEVELDLDSGAMRGRVLAGRFAGHALESLDGAALAALRLDLAGDAESSALLEAYLDRRDAGRGANHQGDTDPRRRGSGTGPMSEDEAYQVLGLQPGAGAEEIRSAHRSLMKKLHPDQGGTTYLAARVNEAREVLLRSHR